MKLEKLLEYIKGPDFPSGGTIINKSELPEIYQSGAGEIRLRGTVETEIPAKGKKRITVTEIPYTMLGKVEEFIETVRNMQRSRVLPDIEAVVESWSLLRYSFADIILNETADVQKYTELLYEFSELESSFDYRALLTSNGKPCLMSLYQILYEWLDFYRKTKTKQKHGVVTTDDELIADLQKIKEQFATPRKTKIIDAMK